MTRINLDRGFAAAVAAIAVLNTLSALSMPVPDRRVAPGIVVLWLALLSAHALVYLFGDRIRRRFEMAGYAAAQGALLFGIAVAGAPGPVTVALFMAAVGGCPSLCFSEEFVVLRLVAAVFMAAVGGCCGWFDFAADVEAVVLGSAWLIAAVGG